MKKYDILGVLDTLHLSYKGFGKNRKLMCWNPGHHDTKPSVSIDIDEGVYYCFGCHMKGNIITLVQDITKLNLIDTLKFLSQFEIGNVFDQHTSRKRIIYRNIVQPETDKKSTNITLPQHKSAINNKYLLDVRNITREEIEQYSLYECIEAGKYNGWILIPIYFKQQLVSYFLRDTIGSEKIFAHSEKFVYGWDYLNHTLPYIILTEGIFDYIKTRRVYENVLGLLGNRITPLQLSLIQNFQTIYIFSDNDSGGRWVYLDSMPLLRECNIKIMKLPEGIKDPGSCDDIEIIKNSFNSSIDLIDVICTPEFVQWRLSNVNNVRKTKRTINFKSICV